MSNGWWRGTAVPVAKGLRLLVNSQIGHELRQIENRLTLKAVDKFIMGSATTVDMPKATDQSKCKYPRDMYGSWLPPITRDAFERAQTVAAGLRAYARILAKGKFPGQAGYTVPPTTTSGENPLGSNLTGSHLSGSSPSTSGFTSVRHYSTEASRSYETDSMGMPKKSRSDRPASGQSKESSASSRKDYYRPELPKDYKPSFNNFNPSRNNKERKVPSSRIARLANFGQLGIGLAAGAAAEVTRRAFGFSSQESDEGSKRIANGDNPFLTQANVEKIVQTLCKVRGAALKLGQMLSIQDSETLSPALLQIFERVRHSADFMPIGQVHRQLRLDLGNEWRKKFKEFEDKPFAAASIGQVHRAVALDGRKVAVKVQYPGVAEGIDSDIDNLVSVLSIGGLFPKGMFLENFVKVARRELKLECNYLREARAMKEFGRLLANDKDFYVPKVVDELTSKHVLTAEYVEGVPVDMCINEPQQVRDYIAGKFIELCLYEIFVWRFMQTDPNWSNFYFGKHPVSGKPSLLLLDFGASRSYGKKFVDQYMRIIRAAYDSNKEEMLKWSREIGFLTGFESKIMEKAHCDSISILGETLASSKPYDFSTQDVTRRIHALIPVMLEHRLTSPPEEVYSLHRKLSGAYLLATKLKATVSCGPLFESIHDNYKFGESSDDIDIDTEPAPNK